MPQVPWFPGRAAQKRSSLRHGAFSSLPLCVLITALCSRLTFRALQDGDAAGKVCFLRQGVLGNMRSHGKVRIGRACSARPAAAWCLSAEDAKSLQQVVLVHRHGARFPTKPTGKADIAWPIRTQFWDSYKGHLTPVGSKQLQDTQCALCLQQAVTVGLNYAHLNISERIMLFADQELDAGQAFGRPAIHASPLK